MQGYVRDMVAAVCVSATGGYDRIRQEDEEALAVVTRFIQCEYNDETGSPLAYVHCVMFKESKKDSPRMIFAGVNAVMEVSRNTVSGRAHVLGLVSCNECACARARGLFEATAV